MSRFGSCCTAQRFIFRNAVEVSFYVTITHIDRCAGHMAGGLFKFSVGFVETTGISGAMTTRQVPLFVYCLTLVSRR